MQVTTQKTDKLDYPGYTVRELEILLGMPEKTLYRLVRERQIEAYRDVAGKLRVSREEAYRYARIQ